MEKMKKLLEKAYFELYFTRCFIVPEYKRKLKKYRLRAKRKCEEIAFRVEKNACLLLYALGFGWVNVYGITREYGGPEEGGWWFNSYSLLDSVFVHRCWAEKTEAELYEEYRDCVEGNIYSVLGGTEIEISLEYRKGCSATTERPMYC